MNSMILKMIRWDARYAGGHFFGLFRGKRRRENGEKREKGVRLRSRRRLGAFSFCKRKLHWEIRKVQNFQLKIYIFPKVVFQKCQILETSFHAETSSIWRWESRWPLFWYITSHTGFLAGRGWFSWFRSSPPTPHSNLLAVPPVIWAPFKKWLGSGHHIKDMD